MIVNLSFVFNEAEVVIGIADEAISKCDRNKTEDENDGVKKNSHRNKVVIQDKVAGNISGKKSYG